MNIYESWGLQTLNGFKSVQICLRLERGRDRSYQASENFERTAISCGSVTMHRGLQVFKRLHIIAYNKTIFIHTHNWQRHWLYLIIYNICIQLHAIHLYLFKESILAALTSKYQGTLVKSFQLVLPPQQGHVASEGMSGGVDGPQKCMSTYLPIECQARMNLNMNF